MYSNGQKSPNTVVTPRLSFTKRSRRRFSFSLSMLVIASMLISPFSGVSLQAANGSLAQQNSAETILPPTAETKTAPPWVDPQLPGLALDIEVAPQMLTVGSEFRVTVTINNQSRYTANGVTVTMPIPAGAASYPDSKQKEWLWQINQVNGNSKTTETATMRLAQMPAGGAVVVRVQATAQGLAQPVHEVGGALVAPLETNAKPVGYSYMPGVEASLLSADGRFDIHVPADAATKALTLTYGYSSSASNAATQHVGFKRGFPAFYLTAADGSGHNVQELSKPITIKVSYTPQELEALGLTESSLALFWFDSHQGTNGTWLPLNANVDLLAHTLTAQSNNLGAFAPGDDFRPSESLIPSLKSWQVDLSHGSVSTEREIEVPEEPGGMKPDVTITYNSAATDGPGGMRQKQQSSWVGKGWSLNTGYIVTNKLEPGDSNDPGHYSLVLDDREYSIMRSEALTTTPSLTDPADYAWRTTDESFIRIRAFPNGVSNPDRGGYKLGQPVPRYTWKAWTKDGILYEFEEDAFWGWQECEASTPYASIEAYKWQLSRVTDTHGNTITYSYDRKTQRILPGETCQGVYGVIDWSVWPTTIVWGANSNAGNPNRYKVQFTSIDRPIDLEAERPEAQLGPEVKETQQLEEILVSSNKSDPYNPASWELVRRYDLIFQSGGGWQNYLLSDASDINCNPGDTDCEPVTSTLKLTLKELRLFGSDNVTYLPSQTFTYAHTRGSGFHPNGDWNRLIKVDNNQGGVETFQYQTIGATFASQPYAKHYKNNRRVTSRTMQDGQGHSYTWTYNYQDPALNSLGKQLTSNNSGPNEFPTSAKVYYSEYGTLAISSATGRSWCTEPTPSSRATPTWLKPTPMATRPSTGSAKPTCPTVVIRAIQGRPSQATKLSATTPASSRCATANSSTVGSLRRCCIRVRSVPTPSYPRCSTTSASSSMSTGTA